MTRAATQEERWDRDRDYRKHESPSDASLKLAIVRSDAMQHFYAAERRAGATPLEANERLHFFMKRIDSRSPFEVEQEAVREIMESSK